MADRYNADGVPPLGNIAWLDIPAYKRLPSLAMNSYKFYRGANLGYTVSSELLDLISDGVSEARIISDAAQSVGAPIDQFSTISGAMRIRGIENIEAIKSTQKLYKRLNDIA